MEFPKLEVEISTKLAERLLQSKLGVVRLLREGSLKSLVQATIDGVVDKTNHWMTPAGKRALGIFGY
jgi:hypothetical protein